MPWTGWLTPEETVEGPYWPQCDLALDELAMLLTSARIQCEAYAPDVRYAESVPDAVDIVLDADGVATSAKVPESWRQAQAFQARALWRSGQAGGSDQIGGDGLTVTVFPMDWSIKNLLRPKKGLPVLR